MWHRRASDSDDSLAEACMNAGQKDLAIKNYEKSLALNPENKNGAEMLKKLNETQVSGKPAEKN